MRYILPKSQQSEISARQDYLYDVFHGFCNPVSLYAATKKSNELLAHAYSKLYNIVEILQLNQVFYPAMKRTA